MYMFYTSMIHYIFLQWNLICSRKLIPNSIMTIQMAGVLVGGLIVGQFADYFG